MVFEYSRACWAFVFHRALSGSCFTVSYEGKDEFLDVPLTCALTSKRLESPVRIPGVADAVSEPAVEAALSCSFNLTP
jgi:hypothetical protein